MAFVVLSSLKNVRFLPNDLVKWKVAVLLSLATLLIIYVTVLCLPKGSVLSIDQFNRNQSINKSHRPKMMLPVPALSINESNRNQSINQFHRPKTKLIFMSKDLCATPAIESNYQRTAVIVVLSTRTNFNQRNLVRQTYGSVKIANNVRILAIIFVLAKSDAQVDNEADTKKLLAERDQFGDTIMGDFVDSYRNLTLKTIMAYEWLTEHCRQAELVVKTDDDVVVNIFQLTRQLNSLSPADMVSSNIWGWIHTNEPTVKNVTSRFYASPVDFPSGKFPEHCGGVGYVTTFRVIERIVDDISNSFPGRVSTHEDVFMTAIVPMHINSNSSLPTSESIKLVNQPLTVSYVFQNGRDDKDEFLKNFVKNSTMDKEIKHFNIFRERNSKRIFFLISHNREFEMIYRRLWQIIKKSFLT